MTKKEARQMWCPMVRFSDGDNHSYNRFGANSAVPDECLCVADLCMMWRKDMEGEFDKSGNYSGYCGLGGKP